MVPHNEKATENNTINNISSSQIFGAEPAQAIRPDVLCKIENSDTRRDLTMNSKLAKVEKKQRRRR